MLIKQTYGYDLSIILGLSINYSIRIMESSRILQLKYEICVDRIYLFQTLTEIQQKNFSAYTQYLGSCTVLLYSPEIESIFLSGHWPNATNSVKTHKLSTHIINFYYRQKTQKRRNYTQNQDVIIEILVS